MHARCLGRLRATEPRVGSLDDFADCLMHRESGDGAGAAILRSPVPKRGSVREDERNSVRVLRKRDLLEQPLPNLPGQDTYGFQRLLYHGLSATNVRASLVVMLLVASTPRCDDYDRAARATTPVSERLVD